MNPLLKKGALRACASIGAILAATSMAAAQDDAEEESDDTLDTVEEITITGFKQSILNAIARKRNADIAVESITAADLGRLPDISIADALSRLPGITSQRTSGQASAINIRGLAQQLTFTTLNGREQVTPNGNRSAEFEQFPSELIAAADVCKSTKASLLEGGIAGTVEMKTVRPLTYDDTVVNVNVRGSYNDRAGNIFDADEIGYRLSASIVHPFSEKVGIVVGYARLVQPDVSQRFVGFDFDGNRANDFNGDGENDAVSFGFEAEEQGGNDTRDAVIATLQVKATEEWSWEVDAYYSRFETESFGRGIRVIGPQAANFGNPNTLILNPTVIGTNVTGGTLLRNVEAPTDPANPSQFGLTFQNINDNQFDRDELFTLGSKIEHDGEHIRTSLDFTYSSAESFFANEVSNIFNFQSFDGGVAGISNNFPATPIIQDDQQVTYLLQGTQLPTLDFATDFTDRSVARLGNFGAFPFENDDRLFAIKADIEYKIDSSWLRSIEIGGRFSDRRAEQFRESAGGGFGNDAGFFQFANQAFDPIILTETNSSVECFEGNFANNGFPCFLVVEDPRALFESENGAIELNQNEGFTTGESFTIDEQVLAFYGMANIDSEIGGMGLTGNIGLRVVINEQNSTNQAAEESGLQNFGELNYTEFLPSANFVLRLTDNDLIRFGASRSLSRPALFQLGSGFGVSIVGGIPAGGGAGNPGLRPIISNNLDVSYERYFENGGAFTVAFFYKDLESFIVNESLQIDFAEAGLLPALEQLDQFETLTTTVGIFGGPVNADGGNVWGFEVAYAQSFDALPEPFNRFGVSANYSFTQSQIDFTASNTGQQLTFDLPGLSDHVVNAQFFYEHEGVGFRVSPRYRSEFVSPQIGINQQLPQTDDEFVVDLQASYEFPEDSALAGFTILAQANNITDEPVSTFFAPGLTGTVQFFGRQFFLGGSYRF